MKQTSAEQPESTHQDPAAAATRPPRWRIADLIDFEFFLAEDRGADAARLQERDHRILLGWSQGAGSQDRSGAVLSRPVLFWQWLQARRASAAAPELLPGAMFALAHGLLWKLAGFLGLFLGAGVAAGLLRYEGTQPVNVAVYFGALVLLQILWVMGTTAVLLLRKAGWFPVRGTTGLAILRSFWVWLAVRLHRHVFAKATGEARLRMESFLGSFRFRQSMYGEVLVWPAVSLLQWFGVAFNVGVLAATLWLVTVSDRAFGWQSAVRFEPARVHALVRAVAWPWSWCLPAGVGFPTLEEVRGSQIVLKDGIRSLATKDLVSWWPFLTLSVAVYGFCPRLVLLWLSWTWGRRAVRGLKLSQVACDRLFERMTGGLLETSGAGEPDQPHTLVEEEFEAGVEPDLGEGACLDAGSAVVLLDPELHELIDLRQLRRALSRQVGWCPGLLLPMHKDPLEDGTAWSRLAALRWADGQPRVVVLQEAWQPPIAENLGYLKRLRKVLGTQARMTVALIGKPQGNNLLTAPRESDQRIWEQRLASLADPQLRVEPWGNHDDE